MSQDHQFFHRATRAATIGLITQVVLGIYVALVGLWAQGPALHVATWHLFGGLPIWVILLVLYHQHRLERMESLEAEHLSKTDAQAAALFDEHAEDLQMARKRLDTIYRIALPVVSILLAIYLLAVGGSYFYVNLHAFKSGELVKTALGGQAAQMSGLFTLFWITITLAFIAFIVARYESGMTLIREWQLLRGGASYLMGNTLVGILLAVGAFVSWVREGDLTPFAILALLIPGLMVLIGAEIALNFLLDMYRPRRPGEINRPALDSRVLGLLTKPESIAKAIGDTINYQFGFEVSRSWFYQLLAKSITPLFFVGVFVMLAISSVVVVEPHQQAVVTRFGKIVGEPLNPGIHLKAPWPIGKVETYPVQRVHQVIVGSIKSLVDSNTAILWTNKHSTEKEEYLVTAPTPLSTANAMSLSSIMNSPQSGTPGMSLIGAQITVQYRIANLKAALVAAQNPDRMLEAIAEREVAMYFATQTIDQLIGPERMKASESLRERIQVAADTTLQDAMGKPQNLGLQILSVGFSAVHPPSESEVAATFHEQIGALQERQATIEKANQDATEIYATVAGTREQAIEIDAAISKLVTLKAELEQRRDKDAAKFAEQEKLVLKQESVIEDLLASVNGKAAEVINQARAYRWQRAITERAKAERFKAELTAYEKAPSLYRTRRYLEVLSDGMGNSRRIVLGSQTNEDPIFRLDLKENISTLDGIFKDPAN